MLMIVTSDKNKRERSTTKVSSIHGDTEDFWQEYP